MFPSQRLRSTFVFLASFVGFRALAAGPAMSLRLKFWLLVQNLGWLVIFLRPGFGLIND